MTIKENIENRIAELNEEKDRFLNCEMPDWLSANTCVEIIGELKRVLRFIDNTNKKDNKQ